jgi:hypothetical protein
LGHCRRKRVVALLIGETAMPLAALTALQFAGVLMSWLG